MRAGWRPGCPTGWCAAGSARRQPRHGRRCASGAAALSSKASSWMANPSRKSRGRAKTREPAPMIRRDPARAMPRTGKTFLSRRPPIPTARRHVPQLQKSREGGRNPGRGRPRGAGFRPAFPRRIPRREGEGPAARVLRPPRVRRAGDRHRSRCITRNPAGPGLRDRRRAHVAPGEERRREAAHLNGWRRQDACTTPPLPARDRPDGVRRPRLQKNGRPLPRPLSHGCGAPGGI